MSLGVGNLHLKMPGVLVVGDVPQLEAVALREARLACRSGREALYRGLSPVNSLDALQRALQTASPTEHSRRMPLSMAEIISAEESVRGM